MNRNYFIVLVLGFISVSTFHAHAQNKHIEGLVLVLLPQEEINTFNHVFTGSPEPTTHPTERYYTLLEIKTWTDEYQKEYFGSTMNWVVQPITGATEISQLQPRNEDAVVVFNLLSYASQADAENNIRLIDRTIQNQLKSNFYLSVHDIRRSGGGISPLEPSFHFEARQVQSEDIEEKLYRGYAYRWDFFSKNLSLSFNSLVQTWPDCNTTNINQSLPTINTRQVSPLTFGITEALSGEYFNDSAYIVTETDGYKFNQFAFSVQQLTYLSGKYTGIKEVVPEYSGQFIDSQGATNLIQSQPLIGFLVSNSIAKDGVALMDAFYTLLLTVWSDAQNRRLITASDPEIMERVGNIFKDYDARIEVSSVNDASRRITSNQEIMDYLVRFSQLSQSTQYSTLCTAFDRASVRIAASASPTIDGFSGSITLDQYFMGGPNEFQADYSDITTKQALIALRLEQNPGEFTCQIIPSIEKIIVIETRNSNYTCEVINELRN